MKARQRSAGHLERAALFAQRWGTPWQLLPGIGKNSIRVLLVSAGLCPGGSLQLELPAGMVLNSGESVCFGSQAGRYVEPTSQTQGPDNRWTVTFTGITPNPYATYVIERASSPEGPWVPVFAPGLAPDASGTIQFRDPAPLMVAYYRLRVTTDTRRIFTLRNTGPDAVGPISIAVSGNHAADFVLSVDGTSTSLAVGASTTFAITYASFETASRDAVLEVTSGVLEHLSLGLEGGHACLESAAPMLRITNASPGFVAIWWTPATTGYVLQSTDSVAPTNWVNAPSGGSNTIIVPAIGPTRFYRLCKP